MPVMTLEELKRKATEAKVKCQICDFRAFALSGHLADVHKLTVGQYKNRYPDAIVTSILVEAVIRQRPRQRVLSQTGTFDDVWKEMEQWTGTELQALGLKIPTKNPEWIPPKDDDWVFEKRQAGVVSMAIAEGMNLFISGPTECGKTSLVEQIHAYMGRPMLRCNMTGDTSIKNFLGQMKLGDKGTYFEKGILIKAMEAGATLLIDEVDFMPPHIGAVLHPVLEKGRSVFVPDITQTIKAEKGFTVITTANTGGKGDLSGIYTGTEVMNTAFLDRFQLRMEMSYLQPDVEKDLLVRKHKMQENFAKQLVTFAGEIREAFKQGKLEVTLGARKLDDFARVKMKMGVEEAYKLVLLDWLSPEEQQLVLEIKKRCFGTTGPK